MTRSLKFAGLALAALIAVTAVTALGAHAESNDPHFTAFNTKTLKHEPTTISATSEDAATFKSVITIKCTNPEYEVEFGEEVSETLTITPKFTGTEGDPESPHCGANGLKTDVNTEGCHFKLSIVTTISLEVFTGAAEIICPTGKAIDIAITKPSATCTVQIGPQTVTHLYYVNNATDLTIEPKLQFVKYKTSGGVGACGVKDGTYTGEYTGPMTLTGLNGKSEGMDLKVQLFTTP